MSCYSKCSVALLHGADGWTQCVIVVFPDYTTVVPTKSDSDVIICLQLLSETLTCTLQLR